jgi:hypothetical protein
MLVCKLDGYYMILYGLSLYYYFMLESESSYITIAYFLLLLAKVFWDILLLLV